MPFASNIAKVYVKAQSSWGTAAGSWGVADLISSEIVLPELVQEALTSKVFRGSWASFKVEAGAKDGSEFTLAHIPQGTSLSTPSANPTVALGEGAMLRSLLGSAVSIGYKAALASSGHLVGKIAYTNADLTSSFVGQAVIVPVVAAPSARQWAWLKTIDAAGDPDLATPWFDLDGVATNGGPSYGSAVYFASLEQALPFTVRFLMGDGTEILVKDSVCPSGVLDIVGGKQPHIAYGVKGGLWTVTSSQWTPAAYADNYPELPIIGSENGSRTAGFGVDSDNPMPSIKIEMTASFERAGTIAGTGGFAKYLAGDRAQKMTVVELAADWVSVDDGYVGTPYPAGAQIDLSNIPGRAWSVFAPEPQSTSVPKLEPGSGITTVTTVYDFRPPTTAETPTGGTCAIGSEFRIALG